MNAYYFTAISTVDQVRPAQGRYGSAESLQTWDDLSTLIVLGDHPDEAQTQFEGWLRRQPEGEHPRQVEIHKIAAAQFVDQLFTESGAAPLDWRKIVGQMQAQVESTSADDFEQGYWLDVELAIRPDHLPNMDSLQRNLPEDVSTGLNWSADKQFLYLLTVFTAPPPPPEFADGPEAEIFRPDNPPEENSDADDAEELQRLLAMYPQGADKEAAALIQARNSAVAAWLWRRYAAGTRLAANPIRIDPWCGVLGAEK